MNERAWNELRNLGILPNYTEMAAGSALIAAGRTRILCTASVEEGVPPFLRGTGRGWLTAEYAMLPGSTPRRKARDGLKKDGRGVEIGRLIGRSLRASCDLARLGERTITIDCDVLQADGGTRTAAITGGFVALSLAVDRLLKSGALADSPIVRQVAAVSVGLVGGKPALDLDYPMDSHAEADMNIVMTRERGKLGYVEVQGTGEKRPFARAELDALLALSEGGIEKLMAAQIEALGPAAEVIGKKPKLALASNNFDKIKELRALLHDRFDVRSMRDMGIELDVEETGETFQENALLKARTLMERAGCAVVADDSGLLVDALNGRPGVHSARYAGIHGDDEANNRLLIKELQNTPAPRTARYACAIALCRPGHRDLVAFGACEGQILREGRGEGGFGYDPLFLSDDIGMTFAEAPPAQKNAISHRSRAIEQLLKLLEAEDA